MKILKRWGVMALVSVLVLGSMGAALADDTDEPETAKKVVEEGSYPFTPDWAKDLVTFVFYWGFNAEAEPEAGAEAATPFCDALADDTSEVTSLDAAVAAKDAAVCLEIDVTGPNGQLNHGSMVSAVVHWLKDGGIEALGDDYQNVPKGQLLKEFAQHDFGKSFFDPSLSPEGLDLEKSDLDEGDEKEGHGPPAWVKARKANRGKNK